MTLPEQTPEVAASTTPVRAEAASETRKGVIAALSAYLFWGFLPILFRLMEAAGSILIVAERTLWSLVLLAGIIAATGGFGEVLSLIHISEPTRPY